MAEALGAVASSIALAEVALKTLSFLREIKGVQDAFEDLRQQVSRVMIWCESKDGGQVLTGA